ncbi:uncharacterized protein LTR77_003332 [Saxophila tyrrhenica]|uniref:Uncharacterized protein n=1 Tax=Saxophila tyrrhenica TaxID=1690608 RepID=A0AAV9PKN5_9PEZI|nr:hypothetical protein LTR77_003332 [Saxophila tyrrhenica]
MANGGKEDVRGHDGGGDEGGSGTVDGRMAEKDLGVLEEQKLRIAELEKELKEREGHAKIYKYMTVKANEAAVMQGEVYDAMGPMMDEVDGWRGVIARLKADNERLKGENGRLRREEKRLEKENAAFRAEREYPAVVKYVLWAYVITKLLTGF